jgi:hypothetical protein
MISDELIKLGFIQINDIIPEYKYLKRFEKYSYEINISERPDFYEIGLRRHIEHTNYKMFYHKMLRSNTLLDQVNFVFKLIEEDILNIKRDKINEI